MTRRVVGLAVVAVAIQFVGPTRTNPPVDRSVALDVSAVPKPARDVLRRACYDCHSHETRWPWYSRVAPASWLVVSDVNDARGKMNFSRWGRYNAFDRADMLDKACDMATKRSMPVWQYRVVHRSSRLSDADIDAICGWTREESARLTRTGM